MKAKEFQSFVKNYSNLLAKSGATELSNAWNNLLPIFTGKPTLTIAQLSKAIAKINPTNLENNETVADFLKTIPELSHFLDGVAKKTYITDLKALETALQPFEKVSILEIVHLTLEELEKKPAPKKSALRTELVESFAAKLELNLGNPEQFTSLVSEIKSGDKKISVTEVKEIAVRFSKETKANVNTKAKALKAIISRHEALMEGRAKSEATGSSIAA
jgi:hypothetical protein